MNNSDESLAASGKRCFVVMGFGVKTDFATGRKLDLNKSYRLLIKPVVESTGLVCVRADEMPHSGTIDVPMYQELLKADVVIADLSTANPNALYELGIRHALRPRTTIVISEDKLPYPFDLNHIAITSYTHLGDAIDYDEVERFRKVLGQTLNVVLQNEQIDSPVYTVLQNLNPPELRDALKQAGKKVEEAVKNSTATDNVNNGDEGVQTLAMLVERGEQAILKDKFSVAKAMFEEALQLCKDIPDSGAVMHDSYLIQRLVLSTYKSKQPDEISALYEALELLTPLNLKDTNDPETVGLAGAIEKRLFEKGEGEEHLNRAIGCYSRGYYLRNDYYNGINLAYLLNVRMDTPLDTTLEEKLADLVWANRIRREVLVLCEEELVQIEERKQRMADKPDHVKAELTMRDQERKFWCLATKAEACFGLGDLDEFYKTRTEAYSLSHAGWMKETFDSQIGKLKNLLDKYNYLLSTPK